MAAAVLPVLVAWLGTRYVHRSSHRSLLAVTESQMQEGPKNRQPRPLLGLYGATEGNARQDSSGEMNPDSEVNRMEDPASKEMHDRIVRIYRPQLEILNLSPNTLSHVEDLLAERLRSAQDVEDLAKEKRLDPEYADLAHTDAEKAFDDQISAIAGAEVTALIRRIGTVEPQLEQIHEGLSKEFATAGDPLTPKQALDLAEILRTEYAVSSAGADGSGDRISNFDHDTGLADPDRRTLALAAEVLSPYQYESLKGHLAATTVRYAAAGN